MRQTTVHVATYTNDGLNDTTSGWEPLQCGLQAQCSFVQQSSSSTSAGLIAPLLQQQHQSGQQEQLAVQQSSLGSSHLQLYTSLLRQLDAVGWSRIAHVEPTAGGSISSLTLQLRDAGGRLHAATVQLPSGFPANAQAPAVNIHLPKTWKPKWLPGHTLMQLVAQLEQVLDSYQGLWEQLEDIDHHTQLLDPPQALAQPYSCCSRCIALGNGASCQLQLSLAAPRALPAVTLHGPSSVVAGLQSSWYGSAHQVWDEQRSVRQNMEAVLQLSLPAPKPGSRKGCAAVVAAAQHRGPDTPGAGREADVGAAASDDNSDNEGDAAGACAICYSLHLPDPTRPEELGDAPSVSCPGASCGRVFHALCLAEWLGALPTSRRVFDTLFGSCPFCNGPIGVSTRPSVRG